MFPVFLFGSLHCAEVDMARAVNSRCPHCGGPYDPRDGYPDLYGVRLCSPSCQEEWLIFYQYRSSVPDESLPQMADGVSERQIGEPDRWEDSERQME